MGIFLRCNKCKSDHRLGTKTCKKCGVSLANNKKYKISVKTQNGKRIVRHVDTFELAKRVESSLKGKVAEKKILNIHKAPLLSDVWKMYSEWAIANKKSWRNDISRWKWHVAPRVNGKRMDQIFPRDIEEILGKMQKLNSGFKKKDVDERHEILLNEKHSPATKKHVLVLIKRVYNWAIKRELYFGPNPAANIEPPKINNQVTECLTETELSTLLQVLKDWRNQIAALAVKFALFTGLRLDEIIGLEWRDVDLENKFVFLSDPKGEPVKLPISEEATQILEKALELTPILGCRYVFPNKDGNRRVSFGKIWSRIRETGGLPSTFRFHGLRHTYASYLASSGEVDIYTLQKLLNHQTPEMTQRYAHLLDETLRRGANIADKVFGKINEEKKTTDQDSKD